MEYQKYIDDILSSKYIIKIGPTDRAPNGEPYQVLWINSSNEILKDAFPSVIMALGDKGDTLYWRIRPEINVDTTGGITYCGYARFCIIKE